MINKAREMKTDEGRVDRLLHRQMMALVRVLPLFSHNHFSLFFFFLFSSPLPFFFFPISFRFFFLFPFLFLCSFRFSSICFHCFFGSFVFLLAGHLRASPVSSPIHASCVFPSRPCSSHR